MDAIRKIIAAFRNAGPRQNLAAVFLALMIALSGGAWSAYLIPHQAAPEEEAAEAKTLHYSEFLKMVADGKIAKALITASKVEAEGADGQEYILYHDRLLYTSTFPKDLSDAGVDVRFPTPDDRTVAEYVSMIAQGVFTGAILLFFGVIAVVLFMNMRGTNIAGWPNVAKDVTTKFADVAGQAESKFELEEIKEFLRNPEAYEVTGAKPPRGILMVGPPGTGKTLLARALAGEAGVSFIPVTGSDFSAMFVGVGRNRIEKLFRKARKKAPCIIFIDEIDSVARRRGGSSTDVSREQDTTLNQLLTEMNGFKPRDGIVVIGATNRIDVLDPALLRPGRFDRHVHVNNSDMDGRREILAVHVKSKPLSKDVDLMTVARGTPGFSGADLENLVNEAAILAARQRMREITQAHFEEARDKVLMGLKRQSMVLDEAERKLIAVHEAGHAVVACLTPGSDPVHQATIVPRGRALGLVMRLPERDRVSVPKSKLLADLDVLMAGRAAEEIVLGAENVTSGAESDIAEATRIARQMVAKWGMSPEIGMVRAADADGELPPAVEAEVKKNIDLAYSRAKDLLVSNRRALDAMAQALLVQNTLDGQEVRAIAAKEAA